MPIPRDDAATSLQQTTPAGRLRHTDDARKQSWRALKKVLRKNLAFCRKLRHRDFSPYFLERLKKYEQGLMQVLARGYPVCGHLARRLERRRAGILGYLKRYQAADASPSAVLVEIQQMRVDKFLLDYAQFLDADVEQLRTAHRYQGADWVMRARHWARRVQHLDEAAAPGGSVDKGQQKLVEEDLAFAAIELKHDHELLVLQIRTYEERTRLRHSDLDLLISKGSWSGLARKLALDEAQVDTLVPLSRVGQLENLRAVIGRAQDTYFDVLEDNGKYFKLSAHAKAIREKQLQEREKRKEEEASKETVGPALGGAVQQEEGKGDEDEDNLLLEHVREEYHTFLDSLTSDEESVG